MTISQQQLHRIHSITLEHGVQPANVVTLPGLNPCKTTPTARETAIVNTGHLVEFFLAEGEQAKARYRLTGCFADRGAMDAAALNAKAALRLMETLIKGRSAETVARMEAERGLSGR